MMKNNDNVSRRDFFSKFLTPVNSALNSTFNAPQEKSNDPNINITLMTKSEADEIIKDSNSVHFLRFAPKPAPKKG